MHFIKGEIEMKFRIILLIFIILCVQYFSYAEESSDKGFWGGIGDWVSNATSDVNNWANEAASDIQNWTGDVASGAWEGVNTFFNPPSTEGIPSIAPEPELPEGTMKMYLGYEPVNTGLDNGYSNENSIGRGDPHFGMTLGKFYISGFTSAINDSEGNFIFLKTLGDNVELHYELVQDINMLDGDTSVSINADNGGYDKYFGISPTYFGQGTLIVRHTDYQNNKGEPQVYTNYLAAKMTGEADTVISLKEEGDYEVALDYEIKKDSRILGLGATTSNYTNYKVFFKFSVRNGNCMIYPFDAMTEAELQNTSIAENGFKLDLARSRYLTIDVTRSIIVESPTGMIEDVRFNRPAKDGDVYGDEGIYTISVKNKYTGESTVKTIFVGSEELLEEYISNGFSADRLG